MMDIRYRHEMKYLIDLPQLHFLKIQAQTILSPDLNAVNGIYNIRSIYFDDYYDSCYYENLNGSDPREKFRIRIYNHSDQRISLECKRKENNKTLKTSCLITKEQCLQLIRGQLVNDYLNQNFLLQKICAKMLNDGLKPVNIVEYDRLPFVYADGNVRITFDTNIASSTCISAFFADSIPRRSVLPIGMNLLEVKYDEFLPDNIYNILQLDSLSQTAFSKYYLGRCYEFGNIV